MPITGLKRRGANTTYLLTRTMVDDLKICMHMLSLGGSSKEADLASSANNKQLCCCGLINLHYAQFRMQFTVALILH